jgi:hypothetical protein
MSLNKYVSLMACFSVASLSVGLGTMSVAVASNHSPHRVHQTSKVHHRYFGKPAYGYYSTPAYGYYSTPPYGYAPLGQYVPSVSDRLIHGPGYVFVPGHGILDEDCNMPTSTCPNEYRNVR